MKIFLLSLIASILFFYAKYMMGIKRLIPAIIIAIVVTIIYYISKSETDFKPKD